MTHPLLGSFQEIVVARGSTLELLRPDEATSKLVTVASMPTFSVIRSLKAFRLHGANRVKAGKHIERKEKNVPPPPQNEGGHCETIHYS